MTVNPDFSDKYFPVVWAAMGSRKHTRKIIGICGKDWAPAFFTHDLLVALITKDVRVDHNGCQDQDRCLNLQCPHNKTTPETLIAVKPMFRYPSTQKMLRDKWPLFVQQFHQAHIEVAAYCKKIYDKDGLAGVIWVDWKLKPSERERALPNE